MKWLAVCVVLLAGVTRAAEAPRAADALAETIAPYKKPGEKLEIADFILPPVPAADNAADELLGAANAIKDKTSAFQAFDKLDNFTPPLSDATANALRKMLAENPAVVPAVDAAMQRAGVDWHIKMKSPVFETLLRHLNGQRGLANFLAAHADLAHHDGDDAEALRDVRRLLVVGRACDHQGFVVGHLVSLGISGLACQVIERIAPDLKLDDPKQLEEVVAMLLDDGPQRAGMRDGLLSERMSQIDTTRCLVEGKLTVARLLQMSGRNNPPAPAPVRNISPQQASADLALLLKHSTAMLDTFDATSNWPAYQSREPARPAEFNGNLAQHPVGTLMFASLSRAIEMHYRTATDRRLAAVALAVRTYTLAHDGKRPDSLDALVPQYLSGVPDDPMTDAMPLQYQSDPQRPVVYSVGANGTDDGGSEGSAQANPGSHWQTDDAVTHLSRPSAKK